MAGGIPGGCMDYRSWARGGGGSKLIHKAAVKESWKKSPGLNVPLKRKEEPGGSKSKGKGKRKGGVAGQTKL